MTASIEERCKQKGVKLTDQRKLIAQVMSNSHDLKDMNYMNIVFLYKEGRLTKNLIKPLYLS